MGYLYPYIVQNMKMSLAQHKGEIVCISSTWNENEIIFKMIYKWNVAWGQRTVKGKPDISYQGVNFLAIDWAFLERIKEFLEKLSH